MFSAEKIEIYAPDGRRYETYEETVQRLYALDGRQIVVYKPEVLSYLKLGFRLVTVTEMAREKGVQLTNGMVYLGL